jgi:hypothetical protein
VAVVVGCRKRQWIWLGAALYCVGLVLNWPNPNARYLVPLAPLLIAGIVLGLRPAFVRWTSGPATIERRLLIGLLAAAGILTILRFAVPVWPYEFTSIPLWVLAAALAARLFIVGRGEQTARKTAEAIGWAFVISVIGCSSVLYAIDLAVARSNRYYDRYEAGFHDELIEACYQLNQMNLSDGELAVSEKYQNLGKTRKSKYAVRAAALLTNRVVTPVPDKLAGEPPRPNLVRWCQRRDVVYYLNQKPNVPWRVWHYVLPRWLNAKLTHDSIGPDSGGWTLYKLNYLAVPVVAVKPIPGARSADAYAGWPGSFKVPTTIPTTRPAVEYRRSASMIELPNVRDWPTRVPGL